MTTHTDTDPRWWQHSSLTDTRSVVGAAAILLGVLFFLLVPPFVDDRTSYSELTPDGRIAVDEYFSFQIAGGWEISERSEIFLIIAKGGAQAVVPGSVEADPSIAVDAYAQTLADALSNDTTTSWRVSPVQPFTTDAGDEGVTYVGHSPDQATAVWIVQANGRQVDLTVIFPETSFDTLYGDAEAMARSIEISATPQGGEG